MERLFLIVRVAGESAAIDADIVGSVVEVDAITPVPRVPPHVAGLFALRSRVLTVIDSQCALGLAPASRVAGAVAVIVSIDGKSINDVGTFKSLVSTRADGWQIVLTRNGQTIRSYISG